MTKLRVISLLLSAILIGLFIVYLVHFSTGIPKGDDFPMMFKFLDSWGQSKLFYEKYLLLTEQFLDHRMVAMKLTVLGVKAIHGKMSIDAVNGVGVAVWFATLYIIYRAFSYAKLPVITFLPVLLLTLHPGYGFEGLLWAATWMAFPWAIFLCLASFYFLIFHHSRAAIIAAWLFAFFALFSHGNGIFSFLIGLLILLAQRRWKLSLIWSGVSVIALILFFFNYTSGGTSASSPLENLISRPLYVISSIGAFTGASIFFPDYELTDITSQNVTAIIFGLILCLLIGIYSIYIFWKLWSTNPSFSTKQTKEPLLLFCCAVGIFIVVTAVTISCVRTDSNILRGFAARYHFYSALLISVVYLMGLSLFPNLVKNTKFQVASLALGIFYCFGQYWFQTADLANHVRIYQSGLFNSRKSGMWVLYKDARFWERGLDQYSNEKLWPNGSSNYKLPAVTLHPDMAGQKQLALNNLPADQLVEIENTEDSLSIHVRGSFFKIASLGDVSNGVYVNLVSENKSFLYPLYQQRSGLRQFLRDQVYYKPEGRISLKKKWFAPGNYQLYIYVVDNNRKVLVRTEKLITIKKYPYEV